MEAVEAATQTEEFAASREQAATLIAAAVKGQQCRKELATSHPPAYTTVDGSSAAAIACRVLGEVTGSTVDLDAKYESLGLTSMQMMQFNSQLSETLGVEEFSMEGLMFAKGTVGEVIRELVATGDSSSLAHDSALDDSGGAVQPLQPLEEQPLHGFDHPGAIESQQATRHATRPLNVPLYLAFEAALMVALQLADALPLCAAHLLWRTTPVPS